jgi:hypothetical protein
MPNNQYGDDWDGQSVTTNWRPRVKDAAAVAPGADPLAMQARERMRKRTTPPSNPEATAVRPSEVRSFESAVGIVPQEQ